MQYTSSAGHFQTFNRSPRKAAARVERGATVVECAVILPLFLLLVVGILEFARYAANRSQVESALRAAGEHGATLEGDCLTPARDRFFGIMAALKSGSELTFNATVVQFAGNVWAIRIVVSGSELTLLGGLSLGLRAVGYFPIESQFGCVNPKSLTSTSADYARDHPAPR